MRLLPIVRLTNLLIILMGVGVLFSVISLVTFSIRSGLNHELQFYSSYFLSGAFFRLFLLVLLTAGLVFLRRFIFQFVRQQEQLEELREKEGRLATAVRGAHEGLWEWDIQTGYVYYSEPYRELLGYDELPFGESIDTFNALLHPDDKDGVLQAFDRHLESKDMYSVRYRLKTGSGEYRWFYSRGYAEYDTSGEAVRMTGLIHDVTEQVKIEKALAEASRQVKGVTTEEVFKSIADYLSRTLDVHFVVISRIYEDAPEEAHLLAYKVGDEFKELFSYVLEGTPCYDVWQGSFCVYPNGVSERYPEDEHLIEVGAESYAGVPLVNSKGKIIGLLAVIDTKPFEDEGYVEMMLDLFATRASSTLERHIVEEKLADSRQRYQRIFELGLVGMAISTKSKSYLEVNDRFCEMLGYSREEYEALTWQEITHEDDLAMSQLYYDRLLGGEIDGYQISKRYIHRDGHIVHIQLSVKGILSETGEVEYIVALIDDVTEKVEALEQLKEKEALYRSYFETKLVGALVVTGAGQVVDVNACFCDILGYTEEELRQFTWRDVTHPEDVEASLAQYEQIFSGAVDQFVIQKRYIHQDGSVIHANTSVAAVRDETGEIDYMYVVVQDVTDRVMAERRLKESEARYRGYFEMGVVGMALSDPNMRWIQVNDRICEMLGYSREEMLKMTWSDISHADEMDQNMSLFDQAMRGEIDRYSLEKKYRCKEGGLIHVHVSVASVRNERGEVEYFVTAIQDMTERIIEDERRQRMINELDHRVKNNLASVLSLASLSIQASSSLETFEENFTGRILALASAHEQLAAREWENVPLSEMIVQTLSPYVGDNILLNASDEDENVDVKVMLGGEDILLESKQMSALSLAVHELVTNALKYGALSVGEGRMDISWEVEGEVLVIDWVETEIPRVEVESEAGVGLNITKGMVEFELNGAFEIKFSNHSVIVAMRIPLGEEDHRGIGGGGPTPVLNETFEKLSPLVKKN